MPVSKALKELDFKVKTPSKFPFEVTGEYAFIEHLPGNKTAITINYIGKFAEKIVTGQVSQLPIKIAGTKINVSPRFSVDGIKTSGTFSKFYWNDQGTSYVLSSSGVNNPVGTKTGGLTEEQMLSVISSIQ